MSYDEIELEDMDWSEELQAFTYACPCGDVFQITKEDLLMGEEIANCPSCSLYITVVYNPDDLADLFGKGGDASAMGGGAQPPAPPAIKAN